MATEVTVIICSLLLLCEEFILFRFGFLDSSLACAMVSGLIRYQRGFMSSHAMLTRFCMCHLLQLILKYIKTKQRNVDRKSNAITLSAAYGEFGMFRSSNIK